MFYVSNEYISQYLCQKILVSSFINDKGGILQYLSEQKMSHVLNNNDTLDFCHILHELCNV